MHKFFIDDIPAGNYIITGQNANHIIKSLRMKVGESITLCNNGIDYECEISNFTSDSVEVKVITSSKCENEPNVSVTIFQGLPKSDKMDTIVQKCVELGVDRIVPVLTYRSILRPDAKASIKKVERWQKISHEAAKQSHRGKVPVIDNIIGFEKALSDLNNFDCTLLFYEGGGEKINNLIPQNAKSIAVFIGPEGGFEEDEVNKILQLGGQCATLGKRILRTETAPITALSIIMYITGNI